MSVTALHNSSAPGSAPSTARRSQPNTLHFDPNTAAGSHRSVSQQSYKPRSRSHSQDLGQHQQPHHPHPTHVTGTTAHQHHTVEVAGVVAGGNLNAPSTYGWKMAK